MKVYSAIDTHTDTDTDTDKDMDKDTDTQPRINSTYLVNSVLASDYSSRNEVKVKVYSEMDTNTNTDTDTQARTGTHMHVFDKQIHHKGPRTHRMNLHQTNQLYYQPPFEALELLLSLSVMAPSACGSLP